MTTVINHPSDNELVRVLVKGASEVILGRCSKYIGEEGAIEEFDEDDANGKKEEIKTEVIGKFADKAYRTLTLAYKDIPKETYDELDLELDEDDVRSLEKDLILISVVGIQDPLRPEIIGAIEQCERSGVTVRMVTGDFIKTAVAISKEAGILKRKDLDKPYSAMTGKDFREMVGPIKE